MYVEMYKEAAANAAASSFVFTEFAACLIWFHLFLTGHSDS